MGVILWKRQSNNSQPKSKESRQRHKTRYTHTKLITSKTGIAKSAFNLHREIQSLTYLPRPEELNTPLHHQIKATYMNLPKKEIQDKIAELQADQVWKGYTIPKHEFITILQGLL